MPQVTPLGLLRPFFTDKCGKLLVGGKVFTYEANSLTPKITYADSNGLMPNTNPVILDKSGEADIFLNGNYRFQVFARNGVLIQDIDNVRTWLADISANSVLYKNTNQATFNQQIESSLTNNQAQINLKPSQQYIDEQLNLKAPKETTYTKIEVDTAFAAYVGGRKAYTTLALAQAAQATLLANTAIEVTNDGANNGTYQWDGTTLTKSNYDPLTQAKKYTDDSTKWLDITRGVNIADPSMMLVGRYYNYLDGTVRWVDGNYAAGLYEIEGATEYRVPPTYSQQFAFFTEQKNYISGMSDAGVAHKFTTPANAKYIGLTIPEGEANSFMLTKSNEYPKAYTPYSTIMKDLAIDASKVENLFEDVRENIGLHAINILNPDEALEGYYVSYQTGELAFAAGFYAAGPYEVKPGTEYQTSSDYAQQFAFYDKRMVYISGLPSPNAEHKFTTPANAKYIKLSVSTALLNTLVVSESSRFPASFLPFGSVQIDGLIVEDGIKTTEITVSADTNDTAAKFTGKNAIQLALGSITDATAKNRYVIIVKKGLYKITQANEFIGYRGYPAMVVPKDHVDIIGSGEGKTIVWAELPYDDADVGASIDGNVYPRSQYQTLYDYADDCEIKDITFVAKNLRYVNHIDDVRGTDKTHKYKNVGMIFKGDIGSQMAYGTGTHSGEETYVVGGRSHSDSHIPYSCHNNIAFAKPSLWSFRGHNFTSLSGKIAIYQQNDGSLLGDKLELIGCSFGGASYRIDYVEYWLSANTANNYDSFNHAEWQITGYGNEPFLFNNEVMGQSLRFKTIAVGSGNSIRIDKTSSAYSILIKNNQTNADTGLYIDSREHIDGYIVQDGSVGLAAQAWGCKDVSAIAGAYDAGVIYTSLAKRLGDCSTVNKSLGVVVNGVMNTITFNKNYSAMTNAQIVSEINTQLSGVTVDLYSYGRDYYPLMSDVSETVYNTGVTYIPKGSVVAKSQGTVKLADAGDKVYGVALDNIPVVTIKTDGEKRGQGRILKRGYIHADRSKAHFVLADNQNPAIGTRFKVSNGQLITDINGKISVDIDTGVISINC